ncbi:MAG TPA: acyltransferase [Candidatus Limnocylindrales bacterium]|nr:acyltransferase [Candidatus Limnocylindrales bacterium]
MYRFLPAPVLGALTLAAIVLNTILISIPYFSVAIVKFVVPVAAWRHFWTVPLVWVAELWIRINNLILDATQPTQWDFRGLDDPRLSRKGRYLVTSNHQTWADILVLQRLLIDHVPFLRFFIKQELIWVPILGLAWWAADMPFMKRYSKAKLARHPELAGKDLETTRKACEHFRRGPISIMNFIEGTRFTRQKHDGQESPYVHLLKPKAGGVAAVLDALSGDLGTLVNVTIVYPGARPNLWDFVCGRVSRVICETTVEDIPADLHGRDYTADDIHRERMQIWIRELWARKDQRFTQLEAESAGSRPSSRRQRRAA